MSVDLKKERELNDATKAIISVAFLVFVLILVAVMGCDSEDSASAPDKLEAYREAVRKYPNWGFLLYLRVLQRLWDSPDGRCGLVDPNVPRKSESV